MVIIVYILNQEVIHHTQIVDSDPIPYYGKNNNNKKEEKVNLKNNCINRNGSYSENGYPNEYTPLRYSARKKEKKGKKLSRNQLNFSSHYFRTKQSSLRRF